MTTAAAAGVVARLTDVSRVYPPRAGHAAVHALGPLSLELHKGEFFSVVGPSGCGKSTLLDVLAGLALPSQGTVRVTIVQRSISAAAVCSPSPVGDGQDSTCTLTV